MGERSVPSLDASGPAAPPRRNGELVFAAPWESRLFGLTLALHAEGRFAWEEFRQRLIAEVSLRDRAAADGAPFAYYEAWLAALEALLAAKGLCSGVELAARAEALAARSPGHDHAHPHEVSAGRPRSR
ncbi:MAG TPA: nitrile hydratase accessory protein [Myxococcota bacterium]|jgi:nitrile hydratase accessory protein|nr:nitrile hydratase accessory protein [Myxococcota bacterium]